MTTEELLMLNTITDKTALEKLQKALLKTKWFSRFSNPEDLTIDVVEECYSKVAEKYEVTIGYIMRASKYSWTAMLKHTDTHAWIYTCAGASLYEIMVKTMIVFYAHLIQGKQFMDKEIGHNGANRKK